jgi:mannose-6-phosphate isomerase-like protein (cupin superfamily)
VGNSSIIDRSSVAKDWHSRGFSCGVWIDHAGREWKGSTDESAELFMVMSGELELEIGEERFQPSVGEEIHIPGSVSYRIRNIGGTTARWLYGQKRNPSSTLQPIDSMGNFIHSPL